MDIQKTLSNFKSDIDREVDIFFKKTIAESKKRDRFITSALEYTRKCVLSGGKRIRPALMYFGYLGAGGKEREKMLKTSVSIELIHAFLLIHDDIIDRDYLRHNMATINAHYAKIGRRHFGLKDGTHFGDSMAIIVGDMVGALGSQIIFNSGFSDRCVMEALTKLQSIVSMTVIGQSKDLYMEYSGRANQKEILDMYKHKTAKYTLEGPLHLGATLGGADKTLLRSLSAYAIPVGVAFQIQDDILGIFGEEKKVGKVIGSDIAEKKQTLLLVKTLERASRTQKKALDDIFKKGAGITARDIERFRNIVVETGALSLVRALAIDLIKKGQRSLSRARLANETGEFLYGLADFMIRRKL